MTEIYNADNPLKILSLGWGVQSWTLAAMAALGEIPMPDYAVHADRKIRLRNRNSSVYY